MIVAALACVGEPTPVDSAWTATSPADSAPTDTGGGCEAYGTAVAMGVVQDDALDELSGLAVSRRNPGILWTHEDSGGEPELYALDATGTTVATLTLDAPNVDWEDLAIGPCGAGWCIHVGDIGDLGAGRSEFAVLVVEEPLLDEGVSTTVTPEIRPFVYPDGAEDAEGLALTPEGDALIVTKRADATAGLYRLSAGADVLEHLSDVATGVEGEDLTARATAADGFGGRLLVRTYLHLYEFGLADPTSPTGPDNVGFALEIQGEAVAYDPILGGFWQVSEGVGPTLWWTGCE